MSVDWATVRREFPSLEGRTYLNTATFGQLPRCATRAVERHLEHRDREACADFLGWFDDADRIRRSLARLIHAEPEDIAFITNASSALSVIIGGLDWKPGDRVVTLAGEFPNNLYNPAVLAGRGIDFVETPWEGFYETITPATCLVLLSSVNYVTGFRPPLAEISRFLNERGVLFCVDGTQSLGALECDVAAIRPAAVAVDAYKWLLGPTGSGFLYIRPDVRERLRPTVIGWRSDRGWRHVDHLHHGRPVFSANAEKYEGGMLNFLSLYGLGASVEMILELGCAAVERRVMDLAEKARAILRSRGAMLLFDEEPHFDSPVIAARFPGRDPSLLASALQQQRVIVSARHGYLRVSVHFYNNEADLRRFEEVLRDAVSS